MNENNAEHFETAQQIVDAIRDFNKQYSQELAAGGFAHIVLDDFNLADGHIDYCLSEDWLRSWYKEEVDRLVRSLGENPVSPYSWERCFFMELMTAVDAAVEFLYKLKRTSVELREQASELLWDNPPV